MADDRTDGAGVGSAGDQSGGFRIGGGVFPSTSSSAQSFSPGSWDPVGSSQGGLAGDENGFGSSTSGDHVGAFRSQPSIFAQHIVLYNVI